MAEILRGDIYWAELNPIYRNESKDKTGHINFLGRSVIFEMKKVL
jgi:hypothetical protein